MKVTGPWLLVLILLANLSFAAEPIPRVLPPPGLELPAEKRTEIERRLREVVGRAQSHLDHPHIADVGILIKAVDLALKHGEFYATKDSDKALRLLQLADERLEQLSQGQTPWAEQTGRVVRGYRSTVDGSHQPYGLVIPKDIKLDAPVPLYVWLHGRGDKQTDLHFIAERLDRDGQITPPNAIVLHPFGRQCLGFKSAGETDVLQSITHVRKNYKIDPDRIVLIGFSMGGAGAWHLGAHYTDLFVAISPGAGFAETARYTKLKQENYPPRYEQLLWGVYDVPKYVRNLFNRPVIAYSGELDKQIQAARVMEEAYQEHGQQLTHLIGPGVEHKYQPETLAELLKRLDEIVQQGRPKTPQSVTLQTRTLRYNRMDWVEVLGLQEHWQDSRIDATLGDDGTVRVKTQNVTSLRLRPRTKTVISKVSIDGTTLPVEPMGGDGVTLVRKEDAWRVGSPDDASNKLAKRPRLQGPIDDVFLEPFLVVTPSGHDPNERVQRWVESELEHFRDRWRATFRGELRMKRDTEISDEDIKRYHLVVWGTPQSNRVLKRIVSAEDLKLPVRWQDDQVAVGEQQFPAAEHVPLFCYPNPLNRQRYVVVNSGPTFREAHDRTNSQQNPKLPDWAVVNLQQPPSAESPGQIVAADFFDEHWGLKPARAGSHPQSGAPSPTK